MTASGEIREDERWAMALCRRRVEMKLDEIETEVANLPRDESGGYPIYCPDGLRHTGSMSPDQALVWNV